MDSGSIKTSKTYRPKSVTVNFGDDQRSFYRMLSAGRFDYFFSSAEEANYLINSSTENVRAFSMKELTDAPEGNIRWIIFNKNIPPELLARINEAIGIVKRTERYQELVRKMKE